MLLRNRGSMKRIAFVAPWYGDNIPGGAEAALRGITDHLFAAGMDIEILTTTVEKFTADWNKDFYKPGSYTSKNGIPIRRFKIRKRNTAAFDAVNAKLIQKSGLTLEEENTFHKEMINSPDLYDYIRENRAQYSCFVFIPYMFGTTYASATHAACAGLIFSFNKRNEKIIAKNGDNLFRIDASATNRWSMA